MDKKPDKKLSAIEAAKKYVDEQLATMKSFGSDPALSAADYDALVRKVAAATK